MYGIKPSVNLEELDVPQEQLWRYYLGFLPDGKGPFLSPLRREKRPSASLFYADDGTLLLKDFKLGTFNIYQFVAKKFGLKYSDAARKIYEEFKDAVPEAVNIEFREAIRLPTKLQISVRLWEKPDLEYWGQYKISLATLKFFRVIPIKGLWINDKFVRTNYRTYSYEYGDGLRKIYTPEPKTFYNNVPGHLYVNYDKLPKRGKLIIITSSQKDAMVWHEMGYVVTAPQSEGMLHEHLVQDLKRRFKRVIINYNNDETGKKYMKENIMKYDIEHLLITPDSEISEMVKRTKELPKLEL